MLKRYGRQLATIAGPRNCRCRAPSGIPAPQLEAREQVEFRLRWSDDLADLQPTDRIIEPADDATASPPSTRSIYDIFAVLEIGRHEVLRVLASRQTVTMP